MAKTRQMTDNESINIKKRKSVKKSTKKGCKNKKNIVKRKLYSVETLEKAVHLVKKGKSLRESSRNTGVPVATLCRKLKNVSQNAKSGPPQILSASTEKNIANWIKERAKLGIPVTKSQLLDTVQSYIKCLKIDNPFKDDRPGRHWYEAFLRRNSDVSVRTPQNLPASRLVTPEDLKQWFSDIESYLKSHNLFNIDSSRVFNCDESSMQLCPKPDKVLSEKGARSVYKVVKNGEKECISTLFMYGADGSRAPPMVIHKYKDNSRVPQAIANNCPEGWGIGISESGWMTTEVFYEYMVNIFYKWLVTNGIQFPVVVYFDGHSSHMTLPLVSFCKEKEIVLISLYPMSTHVIQPLDIAFFRPMKMEWKKKLQQWLTTNEADKITKDQIAVILKTTLDSMKEEKNIIISGFKAAGLVPFDPSQVNYDFLDKKKKNVNKPPTEAITVDDSTRYTAEYFLLNFENDLDPDLKKQFKICEVAGVWNGDEKNKGLFEYWLSKKQSIDNPKYEKNNIRIKSFENYNNHKIKVLKQPPPEKIQSEVQTVMNQPDLLEQNISSMPSDTSGSSIIYSLEDVEVVMDDSSCSISEALSTGCISDFPPNDNALDLSLVTTQTTSSYSISESLSTGCISEFVTNDNAMDFSVVTTQPTNNFNKENSVPISENLHLTEKNHGCQSKQFSEVFTLPENYLPKKKRQKLLKTGKSKLPSVGTSDEWIAAKRKEEEAKRIKEEKIAEKKKLQEEKKELALKMKNLTQKIKATNQKIKVEKD